MGKMRNARLIHGDANTKRDEAPISGSREGEGPMTPTLAATNGAEEGEEPMPLLLPGYVISSVNTNACPEGSQPIPDASSCRIAADEFGFVFWSWDSWPGDPHGCHKRADSLPIDPLYRETSGVWYNTHVG